MVSLTGKGHSASFRAFAIIVVFFCTHILASDNQAAPSLQSPDHTKARRLNLWGTISVTSGATLAVGGLVPIIHGLTWVDEPFNYGVPAAEIIVGAGVELVSVALIVAGAKMRKKSRSIVSLTYDHNGVGVALDLSLRPASGSR